MNRERLAKDITRWEGVRYEKYKCTSGLWTIAVGHMIKDDEQELLNREKPLSNEEVLAIFDKDLSNAIEDTKKFIDPATIEPEAFEVCVHLCFWIGLPRLQGFKRCKQALLDKDYVLASEELLDSKMGKSDVRGLVNRITELSARMRDV